MQNFVFICHYLLKPCDGSSHGGSLTLKRHHYSFLERNNQVNHIRKSLVVKGEYLQHVFRQYLSRVAPGAVHTQQANYHHQSYVCTWHFHWENEAHIHKKAQHIYMLLIGTICNAHRYCLYVCNGSMCITAANIP